MSTLSNRKLVLTIADSDLAAPRVARALWRSGVDVMSYDVTDPIDELVAAVRVAAPDAIVAELAENRSRLAQIVDTMRQSFGYIPVLLLHRASVRGTRAHTSAEAHLVEPFSLEQIRENIDVLLHPEVNSARRIVRVGDLELNPTSREVWQNRSAVHLTRLEFDLLHFLLRNQGMVVSRTQILDHVWPQPSERTDNIVDVYIAQIRKKTHHSQAPVIDTVRGIGYLVKSRGFRF